MQGGAGPSRGQALVETAVTLPILVLLFFAFLAAGVFAQAYVDLNTAVYLAAASNATAYALPPGQSGGQADQFATETFDATVRHDSLLAPRGFACHGAYQAGGQITCDGSADLLYSQTPLAVVFPFGDPTIRASASAIRSKYRSEKP